MSGVRLISGPAAPCRSLQRPHHVRLTFLFGRNRHVDNHDRVEGVRTDRINDAEVVGMRAASQILTQRKLSRRCGVGIERQFLIFVPVTARLWPL